MATKPKYEYALFTDGRYTGPFVVGPFKTPNAAEKHARRYTDGSPCEVCRMLSPADEAASFAGVSAHDLRHIKTRITNTYKR